MNFKLKKNPYRFVRYKKYVDGVWYDTDGKGNITTPSTTKGQSYNKETGEITYNLGNGATVVSGNTSDIKGTKTTAGQTTYVNGATDPNADSGSNTMETVKTVSAAAPTPSPTVTASAFKSLNNPVATPVASNYLNTFSAMGNGDDLYPKVSKVGNTPLYKQLVNTSAASNKAFNNTSKKYIPDIVEATKQAEELEPVTALGRALENAEDFREKISPFKSTEKETVVVNNTPTQTPKTVKPTNTTPTDEPEDTPTVVPTPTVTPTPTKIDDSPLFQYLQENLIGGNYVFDRDMIDDQDAYDAVVAELTAKFGAEATTKFMTEWASDYIARNGVSPANVRKGLISYEDLYYGGGAGSSSKNGTTLGDIKNALQEKLASLKQNYDRNTTIYNAKESNSDIAKAKSSSNTNLRLARKNFNESANAAGLASGLRAQESEARDLAYKLKLAELSDEEAKNNRLIDKIKSEYDQDVDTAYDAYDNAVEAYNLYNAQQSLAQKQQAAATQAQQKAANKTAVINDVKDSKTASEAVNTVADYVGEGKITAAEGEQILDALGITQTITAQQAFEELPGSTKLALRILNLFR